MRRYTTKPLRRGASTGAGRAPGTAPPAGTPAPGAGTVGPAGVVGGGPAGTAGAVVLAGGVVVGGVGCGGAPGARGAPGNGGVPGKGASVGGTIAFGRTPCHESAMPSAAITARSSLGGSSGAWATNDRVSVRAPFSPRAIPRAATRRVVPGAGRGRLPVTRAPGAACTARRLPAFSRSFSPSA